nr:IclR family transcriptional regulator C-terminal domain-containing protein [Actinomycetospora chiangmaiensis]
MGEEVQDRGYALTSGGVIPGVTSVAAPVFTAGESLPLAVAVALPARTATGAEIDRVVGALLSITATMSSELGAR